MNSSKSKFGQSFLFSTNLAYQTLCQFLFKHECFTKEHLRFLYQEDKYSSIEDVASNFDCLLNSSFPQSVKLACFALLPSVIKTENVPKVEMIKKITTMFVETKKISDQDKQSVLKAILARDIGFLQRCLRPFKPDMDMMMSRFFWRDTISLRYMSKAFLLVSQVDVMEFFLKHHEGKISHHKQQILFGLFDYVREHYEQSNLLFHDLLSAGTRAKYPVIRKTSYELLFILGDNLEETAQRCMEDKACDVCVLYSRRLRSQRLNIMNWTQSDERPWFN